MKLKSYYLKLLSIFLITAMLLTTGIFPMKANAANVIPAAVSETQQAEQPQTEPTQTEQEQTTASQTTQINPAFIKQDMASLYKNGKVKLTNSNKLSASDSTSPAGLLITGDASDLTDTLFTFTDAFDFSDGIVGRLSLDAISSKSNTLSIDFYLDDNTQAFAQMDVIKQKREGKWYSKNQSLDVYDQKITGKHTVSFKIVQSDSKSNVTVLLRSVEFAKITLPVVYLNIDESQGSINDMNADSEHDTECYGSMTIEIPDGYQCEYANTKGETTNLTTQTYDMEYMRGRGNSTWSCDKKPYKIKLDKKADLFNMGKNKHWVLLADYYDPSHLRNKSTYWLGSQLNMPYTPKCVYVDMVMNNVYYGSYLLCEQIRVDSTRVNIDDLEADDDTKAATDAATISGGYLLRMSPYTNETKQCFATARANSFAIESPSFEDYKNETQYNYIKNYMQETENAIYGDNFKNNGKSYSDYMDVDSAVDYYWIQEFSSNGDALVSDSTYLYKVRNGKLYWGPLWDFDYVAWGNNDYEMYSYTSLDVKQISWYDQLFKDKNFTDKIVARWPAIKQKLLELCKDGGQIDTYAQENIYSQQHNRELWGNNYSPEYADITFAQDVIQLKTWIQNRVKWMDENISLLKAQYFTVTYKDGSTTLTTKQIFNGDSLTIPATPVKKGYSLTGWYAKDSAGKEYKVSANDTVTQNMTVYTKWVANKDIVPISKIILGYDTLNLCYYMYYEDDMNTDTEEGMKANIPYELIGGSGVDGQLVWKSSKPSIVSVQDGGQLTIKGTGDAVITVSTKDNKVSAKCKVHVTDEDYYGYDFQLNKQKLSLKNNETAVLTAAPLPSETTELELKWISSDSSIASVKAVGNKVIVTAASKKTGTVQIIGICNGDSGLVTHTCTVTVNASSQTTPVAALQPGDKLTQKNINYQVTSITKNGGTVKVTGTSSKTLTSLSIPDSITVNKKIYKVTAISSNASFKNNKKLTKVTLGANITKIPANTFYQCTALITVRLGKNMQAIGKKAFYGCTKLSRIVLYGNKLKTVDKTAFQKTASAKSIYSKKTYTDYYKKLFTKAGFKNFKMKVLK